MSASARSAVSTSDGRAATRSSSATPRSAKRGSGTHTIATRTAAPSWGGARRGAGRPRKRPIASEPHKTRPHLAARHPVHVIARLASLDALRGSRRTAVSATRSVASPSAPAVARKSVLRALRRAVALSLGRADFRIVHIAPLRGRVELVVEADDKVALARGMQGFQVSAAKALNRLTGRRGTVFPDRYRMRILRTRIEVRSIVCGLPLAPTSAWPETWLLRIELALARSSRPHDSPPRRLWLRSRADEDS